MLNSGDIVEVDLGTPIGSEAGLRRPAVIVTAAGVLRGSPNVVQVVPLTRTIRSSGAEVYVEPDEENQLSAPSAAQCQHVRSVSVDRLIATRGMVGPALLAEIREVLGLLLDL
ncbi:type II toxin-antitoxin system PemK/MazF family toxin [Propioniferax innocua]|nr:type II toxin-antitoxin system PemK/MazF family toxin [Propioniferax innocua]